jgi:DNA repair exonuclease SbcCD ATPase subunit
MLGKVAVERLVDHEKTNKQLSQESKELKRSFALAQSANLDLEKKVAKLAEALKVCQDEKKVAEAALEQSKKELEKVQKTHEDDLSLIESLREKHDRASKVAEDLRVNNANLAKSLSAKDRKILDLEKALAEQDDASKKNMSDILEKLKFLFEEYKKSLNEFLAFVLPLFRLTLEFLNSWSGWKLSSRLSPRLSPALAIVGGVTRKIQMVPPTHERERESS